MSNESNGYGPFRDPSIPSLAEALRQFEGLADESDSRKTRVRAAVAMFGRVMNKPTTDIPAQPNFVMHEFTRIKKRPVGLAAKSLANCKSEMRYLMERCGLATSRSRFRSLSPEWAALRDQLEERQYWKLSRFAAFCSGAGKLPVEVDEGLVDRFREALVASGDVDGPEQKVRDAIRAWNVIAGLPGRDLLMLHLPPAAIPRWTVEPEKFPAGFQEDVAQWLSNLAHVDPEAEDGPVRALRPDSLKSYRHLVFKAATALVHSGRPIEAITSLRPLVEIDGFTSLLRYLRERHGGKPTLALQGLAVVLKSIARKHLKLGEDHVNRMSRICKNYVIEEHETRTHTRLMEFEDEELLAKMLHLPQALLEEASNSKTPAKTAKVLAQIAIAVEIEWQIPFRLKNLNALKLGENIQVVRVGGQPRWIVRFGANETKNRKNLVRELPTESVKFIERAMALYTQHNGYLFPGSKGGAKDRTLLGRQIKEVVEDRLGVPFHAHMMRGLVATMQVKERDGGFEHARAALGDSDDRVVRRHYTSTAEQHLVRKAQTTIQTVRLRTASLVQPNAKTKKVA